MVGRENLKVFALGYSWSYRSPIGLAVAPWWLDQVAGRVTGPGPSASLWIWVDDRSEQCGIATSRKRPQVVLSELLSIATLLLYRVARKN
jgi:hypothetical protein